MKLTRREWVVLGFAVLLYVLGMTIEQSLLDRFEWPYILVVLGIVFFLAKDPQRRVE